MACDRFSPRLAARSSRFTTSSDSVIDVFTFILRIYSLPADTCKQRNGQFPRAPRSRAGSALDGKQHVVLAMDRDIPAELVAFALE
jgi:hypothetical protein